MSCREYWKGTLRMVLPQKLTCEEAIKVLEEMNVSYDYYEDDEVLHPDYPCHYIKNYLYIFDGEELGEQDFVVAEQQDDGSLFIVTSFYNGGTCLGEIIEETINDFTEGEK